MTQTAVQCPKCGGEMWDNRVGKKNPKAPDFKCKDKACDGVIWPPKNGNGRQAKQEVSYGKMDWEEEQEAEERRFMGEAKAGAAQGHRSGNSHSGNGSSAPASAPASPVVVDKLNNLMNGYGICFDYATQLALAAQKKGLEPDVSAMAATLLIQACQKGLL